MAPLATALIHATAKSAAQKMRDRTRPSPVRGEEGEKGGKEERLYLVDRRVRQDPLERIHSPNSPKGREGSG